MKKILILFVLISSFLFAEIDECKSDVYFANGIATSRADAAKAIEAIELEFEVSNPEEYKSVENWNIVYNHTHGIGIDLYESLLQKVYEDDVGKSMKPFIWNISELFGLFKNSFKGLTKKISKKLPKEDLKEYAGGLAKTLAKETALAYNKYNKKFTQEELELMFTYVFDQLIEEGVASYLTKTEDEIKKEESDDVKKHVQSYIRSAKDGHGIIVIAHSQGNLFTNRAYKELHSELDIDNYDWVQNYFHMLGVATPANNVIGSNSPYITFDNDMIQLVPDSLGVNITNPKRYKFNTATGEELETLYSVEAHAFLSSYFSTEGTKSTILDYISSSIQTHSQADSQWEKDEEFDKGTKNYKITVKNKHDSRIIMDKKVFPFNEAKKLYYVDGNISGYVKASCGGDEIVDSWDGQKDDEFYMIDNPEEEKINIDNQQSFGGWVGIGFIKPYIQRCTYVGVMLSIQPAWGNSSMELVSITSTTGVVTQLTLSSWEQAQIVYEPASCTPDLITATVRETNTITGQSHLITDTRLWTFPY